MSFDWYDLWQATIYAGCILIGGVLFTAAVADHSPKSYYLELGKDGTTCVMASIPWDEDSKAFCDTNSGNALLVWKALSATKEVKDLLASPQ